MDLRKCTFSLCLPIYTSLQQQAQIYKLSTRKHKDSFPITVRLAWAYKTKLAGNYQIEKLQSGAPAPSHDLLSLSCQALISTSGKELGTPGLCFPDTPHPHSTIHPTAASRKNYCKPSLKLVSTSRLHFQHSPSTTSHSLLINSYCLFYNDFFYPLLFSLSPNTLATAEFQDFLKSIIGSTFLPTSNLINLDPSLLLNDKPHKSIQVKYKDEGLSSVEKYSKPYTLSCRHFFMSIQFQKCFTFHYSCQFTHVFNFLLQDKNILFIYVRPFFSTFLQFSGYATWLQIQ